MELFENIFRWGLSLVIGLSGICICIYLVYSGIGDIISCFRGSYYTTYIESILIILGGFLVLFILGAAFCYINPPIAHLIGFR